MEILIDGKPLGLPEGTTVLGFDTLGGLLMLAKVESGAFVELRTRAYDPIDPTKEPHTELELAVALVPTLGNTPRTQSLESLRICRNQFGNIVKCPPR